MSTDSWGSEMVSKYSTLVQWSEDDRAFIATVSEFPHLSSFGDTPEEAVEELRGVIEDVLDIMEQEGTKPPVPEELPRSSGQFRVRMPRSLHQRLVERARVEDASLNQLVVSILAEKVGRYEEREASSATNARVSNYPWTMQWESWVAGSLQTYVGLGDYVTHSFSEGWQSPLPTFAFKQSSSQSEDRVVDIGVARERRAVANG
jgi:predicted RNase H-like HicB family nuclease